MMNVRFVEGTRENPEVIYDAQWPVIPRVGDLVEFESGTNQRMHWIVTDVCHIADATEKYVGTHVWIKRSEAY